MRALNPKPGTEFVNHHGRLALLHDHHGSREYWRDYWLSDAARSILARARAGHLGADFRHFDRLVERYVARGSRILEAGCGLGRVVAALRARGYDAVGIDYVPEVVEFAAAAMPDVDIRVGDVERLAFPDASFDCYVSLGVVEHLEWGPLRALIEGRRVLRRGGTAIVEVPYLNPLRRALLPKVRRREEYSALEFHQYYFSVEEFTALLHEAGFSVETTVSNATEAVLFREHPVLAPALKTRYFGTVSKALLRNALPFAPEALRRRYAHMMIYVCRAT